VYNASSEFAPCQSVLCPVTLSPGECNALPQCIAEPLNAYGSNVTVCVDRQCIVANTDEQCFTSQPPSGVAAPQRCGAQVDPSSGARSCQPLPLTCGSFGSKDACDAYAPPVYCRWNPASSACEFIARSHCGNGSSSCSGAQQIVDEFSPYIPAQLATTWPPLALGNDSLDIQELGIIQADVLTFTPRRNLSTVAYGLTDEPLWRLAVNDSTDGGCDCFTNAACQSPQQSYGVAFGDFNSTWKYSCTRLDTVASWNSDSLRSHIWNSTMSGFAIPTPMLSASAYPTVGAAFSAGFLNDSSYSVDHRAYFHACKPLSCSFSVRGHRTAIEVVTQLAGLIGGLAVVARTLCDYLVLICCKTCIQRHVEAHRDRYFPPTATGFESGHDAAFVQQSPLDRVLLTLSGHEDARSDIAPPDSSASPALGTPHARAKA
jgi:hypothetical protein